MSEEGSEAEESSEEDSEASDWEEEEEEESGKLYTILVALSSAIYLIFLKLAVCRQCIQKKEKVFEEEHMN